MTVGLITGSTFGALTGGSMMFRAVWPFVRNDLCAFVSVGSPSDVVPTWIAPTPHLDLPIAGRRGVVGKIVRRTPFSTFMFRRWYRRDACAAVPATAEFLRAHGASRLWVVASGVAVPVGTKVAELLRLPVHVSVHDHHAGHLRAEEQRWLDGPMRELMATAASADFASGSLLDAYSPLMGPSATKEVALTGGDPSGKVRPRHDERKIARRIVFIGNPWAADAMRILASAVRLLNSRRVAEPISIDVFSPSPLRIEGVNSRAPVSSDVLSGLLESYDVGYVPMSFLPRLRRLSETSFPSKIIHFLQVGLPMFAHGPAYAENVKFARSTDTAFASTSRDPSTLANDLSAMLEDQRSRRETSERGQRLYAEYFAPASVGHRLTRLITQR